MAIRKQRAAIAAAFLVTSGVSWGSVARVETPWQPDRERTASWGEKAGSDNAIRGETRKHTNLGKHQDNGLGKERIGVSTDSLQTEMSTEYREGKINKDEEEQLITMAAKEASEIANATEVIRGTKNVGVALEAAKKLAAIGKELIRGSSEAYINEVWSEVVDVYNGLRTFGHTLFSEGWENQSRLSNEIQAVSQTLADIDNWLDTYSTESEYSISEDDK